MKIQRVNSLIAPLTLALFATLTTACDQEQDLDELEAQELDEDLDIDIEEAEESFRSASDYYDPIGTHDLANCSTLAGWARDADTTASTIIQIYKGAPYPFGQYIGTADANLYRADLPFADKNHGFVTATPAALKTGCRERVYIHAMDLDSNGTILWGGNNKLLNLTGKSVICGSIPPEGCGFPGPD